MVRSNYERNTYSFFNKYWKCWYNGNFGWLIILQRNFCWKSIITFLRIFGLNIWNHLSQNMVKKIIMTYAWYSEQLIHQPLIRNSFEFEFTVWQHYCIVDNNDFNFSFFDKRFENIAYCAEILSEKHFTLVIEVDLHVLSTFSFYF